MAQKPRSKGNGDGTLPSSVKFHYLKATQFRTIHADGVIGNVTPRGNIHMAMYSERPAIPREMVHKVNPDGTLGEIDEKETIVREGIVREMEVDVVMNVEIARSIRNWLEDQIQKVEKRK